MLLLLCLSPNYNNNTNTHTYCQGDQSVRFICELELQENVVYEKSRTECEDAFVFVSVFVSECVSVAHTNRQCVYALMKKTNATVCTEHGTRMRTNIRAFMNVFVCV